VKTCVDTTPTARTESACTCTLRAHKPAGKCAVVEVRVRIRVKNLSSFQARRKVPETLDVTTLSSPTGHCGTYRARSTTLSSRTGHRVHLQSKVDHTHLSYRALRCAYRARSTTLSSPTGHCGAPTEQRSTTLSSPTGHCGATEQGRPHSPLLQGTAVHLQS
jgi:hypothetical protein